MLFAGSAVSQPVAPDLKIDRVSQDDGLPTLPVTHAFEDEKGFLWLSTWNGLYRFDGYSYRAFQHVPNDPTSIANDWVSSTMTDLSGRFWVATHGGGLDLMDRDSGTFEHLGQAVDDAMELTSEEIASMTVTNDGSLWLGTTRGLNRVDPETQRVTRFQADPSRPGSLYGSAVRTVFQDANDRIWVGTGNPFVPEGVGALNLLNTADETFERFLIRPDEPASLHNFVQAIVQIDDTTLYVAPWSGGIYEFNLKTYRFSHLTHPLHLEPGVADAKVVALALQPKAHVLWVATYGAGLQRFDLGRRSWTKYAFEADNPFTVPDNRIWGVWFDSVGTMWIGTHAGLAKTSIEGRLPSMDVPGLAKDQWVTDVLEDGDGRIWIAASDNMLRRWHPGTGRVEQYALPKSPCAGWEFPGVGLSHARAGHIWVIGPCGLFAFYPGRGSFSPVLIDVAETEVGSDQAIRVMEASSGLVWIPAHPGPIRVDPRRHSYTLFRADPGDLGTPSSPDVECVFEDRSNRIWVGTASGLNLFDRSSGRWIRYPTGTWQASTAVTSIMGDNDDGLWITTDRDGLEYFHPGVEERPAVFGIREGLHSNTLMMAVRDEQDYKWVLSPTGLSVIDTETGAVRRFNSLDGLVDVRFGRYDMVVLSDGRLAVGGRGSVNLFDPRSYHPSSDPPNIVLETVRARGQRLTPGETASAKEPVVRLKHDQNDLVFDYVGLRVPHPSQIRYEYQLSGVDETWIDVGDERTARYSGLPPGQYTFTVRGAAGSGPWSAVRSFAFTIAPPWWSTRLAFLAYFGLFAAGLILLVRIQVRRIVRAEQHRVRMRELEQARDLKQAYDELERTHTELKETQARLDEMKSRFFANISHEFRTPLTLIIGQTEALLAGADETARAKLEMLARNGRRLLRLINQLLDLSKLEAGGMELQPSRFDLIPFFKNLVYSFESLAREKGVNLTFVSRFDTIPAYFERDKLEKIFLNLVSNALKFTNDGSVEVSLERTRFDENEAVAVTVVDTGVGIAPERLPLVFDRFYQVGSMDRRPYEGTGIGLALVKELVELHGGTVDVQSKVNEGTAFTVVLPLAFPPAEEHESPGEETSPSDTGETFVEADFQEVAVGIAPRHQTPLSSAANLILIVEDNHDVRRYIAENLKERFSLIETTNGRDGLELAIENIPDLIITDVMMPIMDGFDFARKIRDDLRTSHIPIVMLTARAGEENKIEGLEAGIDDYLIKPFSPRELQIRIRNLIDQRRLLRERFATATIIRPTDVSARSMDQEFLQRVLDSIDRNLGDDGYSVETLADEIGMSVSQINRKLSALVDQPAGRLIRSIRLQRAADLLVQHVGTVGEIAYQVGFGSQASFSTAFKKQFGVTPTEYGRGS